MKYSDYLKKRFNAKVHKVSVDAGFSCPNRDGKIGEGGCIYCDNRAFSFQNRNQTQLSLEQQVEEGIEAAQKRFKAEKFIIYFQAHTNTYAPVEELKEKYDIIKRFKDVVGISIGTRPDCVDNEILELIASYADDYDVWIEYGLQSIHNKTLGFINRGHAYEDFLKSIELTRKYPIKICVHLILGLPNETKEMMLETAKEMARLRIDGIKIHPLHVVKGTKLEELYLQGKYLPLELNTYIELLSGFISLLWPDTLIQRLSAYCPKELLVAPEWVSKRNIIESSIS
ncbi:MAG: TIGR01212 family radical SAM protein [Candidatus Omnitrophica bacterium]|nr:TIGR01212 family radical SAM protein [Candidatus Omnitrophota bacterium]